MIAPPNLEKWNQVMDQECIELDGGIGEGGGQILRSALSLSVITGRPFRLRRIRANRAKPGLMRQHLTCVQAAAQISAADVTGAELQSSELLFIPKTLVAGAHHFKIGTAGSTMLVVQTVLPMLLAAQGDSRITIEGGTHNMMAPSSCFLNRVFVPQLRRIGADVELLVEREGLFPAGGGQVVLKVRPSKLQPVVLHDRGKLRGIGAEALLAAVPEHVGLREITAVADHFRLRREQVRHRDLGHRTGPGNVLSVWAEFEHVCELVTVHGERRVAAEQVAERACAELDAYLSSTAVAGEYLADQMLLPLWLAGQGGYRCGEPSSHTLTNLDTLSRFGGPAIDHKQISDGVHEISVC